MALGASLAGMVGVEALRGAIAAWLLLGVGAVYLAWGLRRAGLGEWSRFGHATAGAAICACALAMLALGA